MTTMEIAFTLTDALTDEEIEDLLTEMVEFTRREIEMHHGEIAVSGRAYRVVAEED